MKKKHLAVLYLAIIIFLARLGIYVEQYGKETEKK